MSAQDNIDAAMNRTADYGPDDIIGIEIRGIYDGVSVWKLPSGEMVNRWPVDDRRHKPTQEWIERMEAGE